jgi:uncharacterized protein (UPF0333 family)
MIPALTFFDQIMLVLAVLTAIGMIVTYFYTHPRKKAK